MRPGARVGEPPTTKRVVACHRNRSAELNSGVDEEDTALQPGKAAMLSTEFEGDKYPVEETSNGSHLQDGLPGEDSNLQPFG